MIGLSFSAQAQEQAIDLDSAISMAITNHPNIKAAELDVEKNKSLQNLKYNFGTTDISYQGDGLADNQFGQQVNQIGIVQNFPSPLLGCSDDKLRTPSLFIAPLSDITELAAVKIGLSHDK